MRLLTATLLLCACACVQAQDLSFRNSHRDCARDRVELMFQLSAAVDSGDVNRIAALYDWNGMGTAASRDVMDRLEAVAARPLLDVVPVYPPDPVDDGLVLPPWPLDLADQVPVALRVDQFLPDSTDTVSTTFAMRRRMGCWWVAF